MSLLGMVQIARTTETDLEVCLTVYILVSLVMSTV